MTVWPSICVVLQREAMQAIRQEMIIQDYLLLNLPIYILVLFFLLFLCLYTDTMPTQLLPHAYAEWEGCLRGSFPRLGAYAGASAGFFVGWPCWMAMSRPCLQLRFLMHGVGWCGRLLWIWSGVRLPSCGGESWLVWTPSWALKWSWLPLAPFMCDVTETMSAWPFTVVLANGLGAYARPPRSLREPTRWNQDKSPETI